MEALMILLRKVFQSQQMMWPGARVWEVRIWVKPDFSQGICDLNNIVYLGNNQFYDEQRFTKCKKIQDSIFLSHTEPVCSGVQ